ncbi:NAD(P)H-binding protein [Chondromyces crocatus]|uniref:Hydroxylase n=1 Tax=Chondromyces crocatus TaxID=52 RepID=A0A0K1EHS4_CHOCO|nr:NAD(P)H-binding protein [Chondromyces crocatus]AKT40128.1 hydroxylase [Chondromyces crocatus]
MTILVTGATGSVGRHVVEQLLERGQQVRALTRRPDQAALPREVTVIQGDLTRPDTLSATLEGVDRLYLFPVGDGAEAFVERARRAGVQRIVLLSSSAIARRFDFSEATAEHHLAIERVVEASGIAWTHLRPGWFDGNALTWAQEIRAEGVVRAPHGAAAQALVHEADIAAVAVKALLEDGHAGAKYLLSGPETITRVEQARAIGRVIGKDVRFEEISPDAFRASVRGALPEEVIEMYLGYWALAVDQPDPVWSTVEDVLGRPARPFQQWVAEHASDFA